MLPNILQYPVALTAILRAGYVAVTVNPQYTLRELQHQLNDSGTKAIIIDSALLPMLEKIREKTPLERVIATSIDEPWREVEASTHLADSPVVDSLAKVLGEGRSVPQEKPCITPEDLAVLQYTGGTTGVSKGAMLLHRNLVANVVQNAAWLSPALDAGPQEPLRFFCALPLYHIFAMTVCYLFSARYGGCNLLVPNPRDTGVMLEQIHNFRPHILPAVNTLYNSLMNADAFAGIDLSQLIVCYGGGAAIQRMVADRWKAVTGHAIIEGYGMSETSPTATCNLVTNHSYSGHVGLPVPSTEISIRDDLGRPLPSGESGEICIRGPQVMAGYWQRPEETSAAFTEDGFLKSGDIGALSAEGILQILDRKKDMIIVSGFNVFPNEIEAVAVLHPQVLEAAAVGVPDAQ